MKRRFVLGVALFSICLSAGFTGQTNSGQSVQRSSSVTQAVAPAPRVCAACIRSHMEFLASDALRGRGSGTSDELVAATYVAVQLRQYGIAPAGDDGGYLQKAPLLQQKFTAPPVVTITKAGGEKLTWTYGKEFVAPYISSAQFSGPLRVMNLDEADTSTAGAVVLVLGNDRRKVRAKARSLMGKGAAAVISSVDASLASKFEQRAAQMPVLPIKIEGQDLAGLETNFNLLEITPEAGKILGALPESTIVTFEGKTTGEQTSTWNAVGILRGADPKLQSTAVLLSAHLDHLGVGKPVNGDDIYNGADDDASGTTAVLELARVLGSGPRPRRTVIFALFGSEETGGQGSTFFRQHPPVPLKQIAVNLEFEMLGRPDSAVAPDALWLTGWERSNLGPTLAARGAKLVKDPHPDQNFFQRSDNYVLAQKGVVAQTVSSYGLHHDYHQPSDDVAHIDFKHMDAAIGSLLQPVRWLVNSSFTPAWNEGGRP